MGSVPVTAATSRVERAHAKINLVLRILTREASGYHGIETLFQRLALHDTVTVRVGGNARELTCEGPAMPTAGLGAVPQNLAWRAAELYAQETRWDSGWEIVIDKQIPVSGGLGGGSADAAAVLRAMEAMSPAPLGASRLLELGGQLGSDVPFLVTGASRAWAWGRGDRLLVLPPLPVIQVVLFTFTDGVNTGAAYRALAAMREADNAPVRARRYDVEAFSSWAHIGEIAENDFERVVPAMHAGVATVLPMVKEIAQDCFAGSQLPSFAMLSGSGATCYWVLPGGNFGFPSDWNVLPTETL